MEVGQLLQWVMVVVIRGVDMDMETEQEEDGLATGVLETGA